MSYLVSFFFRSLSIIKLSSFFLPQIIILVPNPCVDLIIENYNMSGSECCQSGDIWVGKWPVVQPALNHNTSSWQPMSTWSSYQWRANKLTIQAWDPLFDGGKVCGKNNDEDCYYYIGVHGWCDLVTYPTLAGAKLGYNIKATLAPAHKIFATPQYNQVFNNNNIYMGVSL